MTLLSVEGLGVSFDGHRVLQGVDFTLEAGRTMAVIGASGCGKSTMLSAIAGLLKRHEGRISLEEGCRAAFIMQDYGLFPWKSVLDNLALPLQLAGVPRGERIAAAERMLDELGLAGVGRRFPLQLSGGQRQRVAIGRALMAKPGLLLMDEPFAALDAISRERLQEHMLDVWRRHRTAFILVTHNSEEAVYLGQSVMVLGGNPATVAGFWQNPCFGRRDAPGSDEQLRRVRRALAGAGEAA